MPLASARLLAGRMTFAPTPQVDQQILDLGLEGFIDDQLARTSPDPNVESLVSGYQSSNPSLFAMRNLDNWTMEREVTHAAILRATFSQNQLYEVLQRLWVDHFNVNFDDQYFWHAHYNDHILRPNGMGSFHNLLVATANSGQMMLYLDNSESGSSGVVNENYGRELLELHTLGIDDEGNQVYTEDDVVGASKVMTGWSFDWDTYQFEYRDYFHTDEPVSLLGGQWSNAGLSGKAAGDSLLFFLSHHPSTARHISRKLIRRFVTDTPPESLVASAAAVYLANDTNVVPVLRHIFGSSEFSNSAGEKVRRPFEQIVAVMRALDVQLTSDPLSDAADRLRYHLIDIAHGPWRHGPPDGYPDVAESWLSSNTMIGRWEGNARVAANDWVNNGQMNYEVGPIRGDSSTAGELFDRVADRLNIGEQTEATKNGILAILDLTADTPSTEIDDDTVRDLIAYLTGHPLFQLR